MNIPFALASAERIARAAVGELAPACSRIEIVGAVRRRVAVVDEIELLAIPRSETIGLFGDSQRSALWARLEALIVQGRLAELRGGELTRRYSISHAPGLALEVYTATPETWGVQMAIRTGPAGFNRDCMTQESHGGRLRDGLMVRDGVVWQRLPDDQEPEAPGIRDARASARLVCERGRFTLIPTPEEADFLALAGGWIEPEDRRGGIPPFTRRQNANARGHTQRRFASRPTAAPLALERR